MQLHILASHRALSVGRATLRDVPLPASMLEPDWVPVWVAVWNALDQHGSGYRGDVDLPAGLSPSVRRRLTTLTGRTIRADGQKIKVAHLDPLLARHDTDLLAALDAVGFSRPSRGDARLAGKHRRSGRDLALDQAAGLLFDEPEQARAWARGVRPGIADDGEAQRAGRVVAQVLEAADTGHRRSRGEVASRVLGGAHRLDTGTRERRWVRAAIAVHAGQPDRDDPDLWADAGLPGDLVSAPVLTWALPLPGADGLAAAVRVLTDIGAPAALTPLTLRDTPVEVPDGTVVLSVENPRLLEAAAQLRLDAPLVCTSGNPTVPAARLLAALVEAGAVVRHHGDVDPSGLAIAARLRERGVEPWRMGAADYLDAVTEAEADGVLLEEIPEHVTIPDTPWDPELAEHVRRLRVVVEEERVMDALLAEHADQARRARTIQAAEA